MLSIKPLLILLTVASQVQSHPALRTCLACVDDSYYNFINDNYGFFREENMAHVRKYDLKNFQCLKDTYLHIQCVNSCVRIHLTSTAQNGTQTVGWMYDCSTELYDNLPFTMPGSPTDLQFYDGEMHFENALGPMHDIKYGFDFEFYSKFHEIETTREYYIREQEDKNDDFLEEGVILDQDESDFPGNDFVETTSHYAITETHALGEIVLLLWISAFVVVILIKLIYSPKKRDAKSRTNIAFHSFDDIEEETVLVEQKPEEEEKEEDEAEEAEEEEHMIEVDLGITI